MPQSLRIDLTENIMHKGKAKNAYWLNMILLPQQDNLKSQIKIVPFSLFAVCLLCSVASVKSQSYLML